MENPAVQVFLSLGTNLGDRKANLAQALEMLTEKVEVLAVSGIYETNPWGVLDQPNFLNLVLEGKTSLTPEELLVFAKKIENQMGRVKSVRYGPRLIDVDILLYGDQRIDTPDLTIPHPRMLERAFVMVPLNEIQPELIIPGEMRKVNDILHEMDTTSVDRLVE